MAVFCSKNAFKCLHFVKVIHIRNSILECVFECLYFSIPMHSDVCILKLECNQMLEPKGNLYYNFSGCTEQLQ